ncbi:magnesium/cobalt transporter CorA [Marinilabilia salmonicolor]|uniref:magnesium/cobalt transporter CorA n=1 Tax=Marinilabilia salmonicolor TaxID=989 RepID=UPI00029B0D4E|nr:magnesium/cobalt transporter CorA [Marinilabilia salmonicolor]
MSRFRLQRKTIEPGIQFVGQQFLDSPAVQLFRFSEQTFAEFSSEADFDLIQTNIGDTDNEVHWINLHGIHDMPLVHKIAEQFGIDRLIIQDIVDTNQRPKVEVYPEYLFVSVKSLLPSNQHNIDSEQISFILMGNVILSFQEKQGDHFEHIRTRIREGKGRVRKGGADYLLYLLLDAITGNCYTTLNNIEMHLDTLPGKIMQEASPEYIVSLEAIKRNLFALRKAVVPIKEAILFTEKGQTNQITLHTLPYFSDLKDQLMQLIDEADINMTRAEGSTNLFFSYQGHRMNEVMKVLTIVATIFIPITFIAGIYGMNFEHIPELSWKFGYPAFWGVIVLSVIGMFIYFRRKKWL